ncbi:MAG: GCN5-like N-acetyltransferase [Promethearchaeota archaeon CR_4]|nr:MAG: GCN5-like N-acetyltransferase [Candidatus Lokiarchaeota archaeon CR_4]
MDIEFKGSPFIGEKVRLRPFETTDLDAIMQWWNTYETRRFLKSFIPHSRGQEEDWLKNAEEEAKKQISFEFAIVEKDTGKLLGGAGLMNINWINRKAMLGIGLHNPANHERGFGTDTMRCLLKFAFQILNLHSVSLSVYEYNPRAIHVYQKVGFKEVGHLREAQFFEGKYYDEILMDCLAHEFSP